MSRTSAGLLCAVWFCMSASAEQLVNTSTSGAPASILSAERASIEADLEAMHETDQRNRLLLNKTTDEVERKKLSDVQIAIDKLNQTRLEEIVKTHGWPGITDFGQKAAQVAFLIVQHSNSKMMKQYYLMLRTAMELGDADKASFALLDDRIPMNDGKPQLYGSQLQRDDKAGKLVYWMIEDEANVDQRRAAMGLGTLAENATRFKNVEYVPYSERIACEQRRKVEQVEENK